MNIRKYQANNKTQKTTGSTQVSGISAIPFEATPQELFRLTVEVEQIDERETKTGNPYYFVQCRDEEGMQFSVVVWASQYARIQSKAQRGATLAIDIRVPKEGYSAFTLAI
jgi:DNA polymerase III alpha subunit